MREIFNLIILLLGGYTVLNTLNLLIWSVAGRFGKADDSHNRKATPSLRRILVLIPAYKEDRVILDSVKANLLQDYPHALYDLVVIADSFQADTIRQLSQLPVKVIEVSFSVSTVCKALNTALLQFPEGAYDIVMVADADNHMSPDFLVRINNAFDAGWLAIQGHRIAKNVNTNVAILDAISEEVNNHIFRKGHRALGFSSTLIGSGMAFDFGLFKKHLPTIKSISGYDKELEMKLLLDKVPIGYLEEAYIFDEKVQTSRMFEHQRTRWVEAQIQQVQIHLKRVVGESLNKNFDYVEKVLQSLTLPRILLLGILTIELAASFAMHINWLTKFVSIQLLLLLLALAIALPVYLRRLINIEVLLMVPVLFVRFSRSVINFRRARGRFLHTAHGAETKAIV